MKEIIKKILKESIPIYKEQTPYKSVWKKFRDTFPTTPEYVLRDFFDATFIKSPKNMVELVYKHNGDTKSMLGSYWIDFLESDWKLKILNVNPEDFNEKTINAFLERDFGNINSYLVPDDLERTKIQKRLAKNDGMNEPIIVIKKNGKYEVIEGWHRTMAILLLGDNGEDMKNWDKVKIRAFVTEV